MSVTPPRVTSHAALEHLKKRHVTPLAHQPSTSQNAGGATSSSAVAGHTRAQAFPVADNPNAAYTSQAELADAKRRHGAALGADIARYEQWSLAAPPHRVVPTGQRGPRASKFEDNDVTQFYKTHDVPEIVHYSQKAYQVLKQYHAVKKGSRDPNATGPIEGFDEMKASRLFDGLQNHSQIRGTEVEMRFGPNYGRRMRTPQRATADARRVAARQAAGKYRLRVRSYSPRQAAAAQRGSGYDRYVTATESDLDGSTWDDEPPHGRSHSRGRGRPHTDKERDRTDKSHKPEIIDSAAPNSTCAYFDRTPRVTSDDTPQEFLSNGGISNQNNPQQQPPKIDPAVRPARGEYTNREHPHSLNVHNFTAIQHDPTRLHPHTRQTAPPPPQNQYTRQPQQRPPQTQQPRPASPTQQHRRGVSRLSEFEQNLDEENGDGVGWINEEELNRMHQNAGVGIWDAFLGAVVRAADREFRQHTRGRQFFTPQGQSQGQSAQSVWRPVGDAQHQRRSSSQQPSRSTNGAPREGIPNGISTRDYQGMENSINNAAVNGQNKINDTHINASTSGGGGGGGSAHANQTTGEPPSNAHNSTLWQALWSPTEVRAPFGTSKEGLEAVTERQGEIHEDIPSHTNLGNDGNDSPLWRRRVQNTLMYDTPIIEQRRDIRGGAAVRPVIVEDHPVPPITPAMAKLEARRSGAKDALSALLALAATPPANPVDASPTMAGEMADILHTVLQTPSTHHASHVISHPGGVSVTSNALPNNSTPAHRHHTTPSTVQIGIEIPASPQLHATPLQQSHQQNRFGVMGSSPAAQFGQSLPTPRTPSSTTSTFDPTHQNSWLNQAWQSMNNLQTQVDSLLQGEANRIKK